ncbi:hypothetical protein [Nocardioides taihuensis]|uniref:Uncharacterized protein n=1 Tax=Nocardioides taihuensis TaxID=1835606 RepID=A0ABW0BEG7_9ACTN
MTDVLYVLITVIAFALMAVLVGVLDRRLTDKTPDRSPQVAPEREAAPVTSEGGDR